MVTFGRPRFVSKEDAAAIAILTLAAVILFLPALAGYLPNARDLLKFTLPAREEIRDAFLAGHLPQWNTRVGLGAPWIGMPVHGVFYPPQWLLLIAPAKFLLGPFFVLHCIWGGVGGYLLARKIGCRAATALVSGLAWDIGGYTVSMWGDGEKVLSGAWIPWVALTIVTLMESREGERDIRFAWMRRATYAAIALAMTAIAGDPFLWLHGVALGVIVAIGVSKDSAWIVIRRLAIRCACAIALATLLASPVLVPLFHVLGDSSRSGGLARDVLGDWSLHPWRACELFAPLAFGSPLDVSTYEGRDLFHGAHAFAPWAITIYAGVAATLPAIASGRSRLTIALILGAFVSILASLGNHTPAYDLMRAIFPPLSFMRYPEKHIVVALGALALLSAIGCERILKGEASLAWPIAVAIAIAGLLFAISPQQWHASFAIGLAHAGVASAFVIAALLFAKKRSRIVWTLPLILAIDLIVAAHPLFRWTDMRTLSSPPPLARAILDAKTHAPPRVHRPLADDRDMATLPNEVGSLWGLAYVPGLDSGTPRHVMDLWDGLLATNGKALPLMSVRWLILPTDSILSGMRVVARDAGFGVVELPHLPRAYLVSRASVMDDAQAIARIASSDFNPQSEVIVSSPDAHDLTRAENDRDATTDRTRAHPDGTCAINTYESERVAIQCDAPRASLLVLADAFATGWSATIDDASTPIVRTNIAMRGVYLPSGKHRVVFAYKTPGLSLGALLFAIGICATAFFRFERKRSEAFSDACDDASK